MLTKWSYHGYWSLLFILYLWHLPQSRMPLAWRGWKTFNLAVRQTTVGNEQHHHMAKPMVIPAAAGKAGSDWHPPKAHMHSFRIISSWYKYLLIVSRSWSIPLTTNASKLQHDKRCIRPTGSEAQAAKSAKYTRVEAKLVWTSCSALVVTASNLIWLFPETIAHCSAAAAMHMKSSKYQMKVRARTIIIIMLKHTPAWYLTGIELTLLATSVDDRLARKICSLLFRSELVTVR